MQTNSSTQADKWADLLKQAVTVPGLVSEAYSAFHGYSLGNQLLALVQCQERGIQPGPMATYPGWQAKGRQVRKGEKAIVLCMPVTSKRKAEADGEDDATFTRFIFRANWFVIEQTNGEPVEALAAPEWNRAQALAALGITEKPFEHLNGNVMGYAKGREIAISPVNPLPHKTTFHELAHILLGHTSEGSFSDGEQTPRNLREVEAESVAMLCCESLGLPGAEYSRGYIQGWLCGAAIPGRSAQKIFAAADKILRAGQQSSTA
jgi:antirestriction protein ArdC